VEISILFLLVLPPTLWAATNLIDRKLVDGDGIDSHPSGVIAIYGLFNLLVAAAIGSWLLVSGNPFASLGDTLALLANGAMHMTAIYLYYHALRQDETSRVAPWFQAVPAFGVIGATLFLHELPSTVQIGAMALLVGGGLWLSIRNGVARRRPMVLMLAAAGLMAGNDVVFAAFGRGNDAMAAILPDIAGKAFWGLLFLVRRQARKSFVLGLKKKFALQSAAGILPIAADSICDLGKLYVPIAIVQATACTTPLFVLLGAWLLTRHFPHILSEELGGAFWRKFGAISTIIAGGVLLAIYS